MKIETKEYILGIIGGCWILFFLLLLIWTKIEAQDLYNTNNITILMAVQIIWASYPFIFKLLNLDGTWNIILNLLISVINIALWIKFFSISFLLQGMMGFIFKMFYDDLIYKLIDDINCKRKIKILMQVESKIQQKMQIYEKIISMLSINENNKEIKRVVDLLTLCTDQTIYSLYNKKYKENNYVILKKIEELSTQNILGLKVQNSTMFEIKTNAEEKLNILQNDIKKLRINCFRQSKVAGEFMLQMRVPGSMIAAKYLQVVQDIAENWGNGTFHIGMRQTLNIPGIKYEYIGEVNKYIKDYIKEVEVEMCDVDMDVTDYGYPTIGARNVMSCIGNTHCIKANVNTYQLARKIEKIIFPSHYHIKVSVSGCPNDCGKGHFNDFGIMGIAKMEYHPERCIGCGACVRACQHHATRVLSLNADNKVDKDTCCCVGCGECVIACPTGAWTRKPTKFYRVTLGGRSGKQYPRMGKIFLNWITEDALLQVFSNWQKFSAWVMDNKPEYIHGGHLIDIAGYPKFKELILDGVELNPECLVAEELYWTESEQRANIHLKPLEQHKKAGPQN